MSPNLRTIVERVLPEPARGWAGPALGRTLDRLGVPPPGLKAGHGNPAGPASPAVVVLLLGEVTVETVAETVAALVQAAAMVGVRPVLVLDGPHFGPARRAGLAVDHLVSPQEWARRYPDRPHSGYLAERIGQLQRDYATRHLVTLPSQGVAGLPDGALAAALVPSSRGRLRQGWQWLAGWLEASIDRPTTGA
jgi:hypothetical protein